MRHSRWGHPSHYWLLAFLVQTYTDYTFGWHLKEDS